MGQEVRGLPEAAALSAAPVRTEESAVGPYLAQQRRLRGISLDDLSSRTKIPRRSLERLEAGAFDQAADGFSRGFVRTVAGALGLDPDDAVMRLLREPPEDTELEPRRAAELRRWLAAAAALLLALVLLSLLVWGLRAMLGSGSQAPAASELLYRRDAVRALADAEARAPVAEPGTGEAEGPTP